MDLLEFKKQSYKLANSAAEYNPAAAIAKAWDKLKAQRTFIGYPIGAEVKLDDGTVVQAFTSGAILHWYGGDDTRLE